MLKLEALILLCLIPVPFILASFFQDLTWKRVAICVLAIGVIAVTFKTQTLIAPTTVAVILALGTIPRVFAAKRRAERLERAGGPTDADVALWCRRKMRARGWEVSGGWGPINLFCKKDGVGRRFVLCLSDWRKFDLVKQKNLSRFVADTGTPANLVVFGEMPASFAASFVDRNIVAIDHLSWMKIEDPLPPKHVPRADRPSDSQPAHPDAEEAVAHRDVSEPETSPNTMEGLPSQATPSYGVFFRTHVWDEGVASIAARAQDGCRHGKFVVTVDDSKAVIDIGSFDKISHTDDFSDLGLPNTPPGRSLWWNADYVLYRCHAVHPDLSYYVMLEYDVMVSFDFDPIIRQCEDRGIDFLAHDIQPLARDHWCRSSAVDLGTELLWAFIPILILSRRALERLCAARLEMAERLRDSHISAWPYCEVFLPTLSKQLDLKQANLGEFIDARYVRFRPPLSVLNSAIGRPGSAAHPVFAGERFIRAFLKYSPAGAHVMSDGRFREEIAGESDEDLRSVFGDEAADLSARMWRQPSSLQSHLNYSDVSTGKCATQSSHSRWSRGPTVQEDAEQALSSDLHNDYAFHTDALDADPWWEVDLGESVQIQVIEILNRVQQPQRFKHFRIETSVNEVDWAIIYQKVDGAMVSSDPNYPAIFLPLQAIRGRYLRITQTSDRVMHLRRVRVLADDPMQPSSTEP